MKILKDNKRYARVELNGVTFTLDKKDPVPHKHYLHGYADIYDAYGKPSQIKVAIWKDWERWFYEHGGDCVISSKNCNFFTIQGWVKDYDTGKEYLALITYANHRLYEVEG